MPDYESSLARTGSTLLATLSAFESIQRHLHPPRIEQLREELGPYGEALEQAIEELRADRPPDSMKAFHERLLEVGGHAISACQTFCETPDPHQWIERVLASMRRVSRALEVLYPLHRFPPINRYFLEPALHSQLTELDPEPPDGVSVGLHATGDGSKPGERGGFCLYVPETYRGTEAWPLVVALHGGSGNGRDFIWAWLREARSRRFLLLAPTAQGGTWSMIGPDVDGAAIRSMVRFVGERWRVDRERILVTGLSDGATYGLLLAFADESPFSAVAPIAGVVHPALLAPPRATNARGKRVYLVHGKLDWMFPVEQARLGSRQLAELGADVVYREIEDLSHTYPREENDRILTWFDDALALPVASEVS